jgi:RimJ/RimL family protein N-acetyltransferase
MKTTFSNENIRIRPYNSQDVEGMFDVVSSSVNEMIEFLPWVYREYSISDATYWVAGTKRNWESELQYDFVVEDIATGQFLGGVGLLGVDRAGKTADLGYWIRTDAAGKGITTAAARLAIQFAREVLELKTLEITVGIKNKASIKVAEKLGGTFIKRIKNYPVSREKTMDANVYKLSF